MKKNNKNTFKWGLDDWTMGKILVHKYFTNNNGDAVLKLKILVPNELRAKDHLGYLLTKDYTNVIITPDEKNIDYLQISFTDIDPIIRE